jgi:hypothetical protein
MLRLSLTYIPLCYPDFNKPFHLYTDASAHQLRAVIMQDDMPIAFYSRKFNTTQKFYKNTERGKEFLSAIETFKEIEYTRISYFQPFVVSKYHKTILSMVKGLNLKSECYCYAGFYSLENMK